MLLMCNGTTLAAIFIIPDDVGNQTREHHTGRYTCLHSIFAAYDWRAPNSSVVRAVRAHCC